MDQDDAIARLLDGDPEVVEGVRVWIRAAFTPYRARLARDLEDIEQEVLLDLTRALRADRFRGDSTLRTYVRRYVHHKCIDRLRALGRRDWLDVADLELASPQRSVDERLASAQNVDLFLRVLEELPESCRELFRMLFHGMHYSEMSRRLGVAAGTLRVRVNRCRGRALAIRARLLQELDVDPGGTGGVTKSATRRPGR